MPSRLINLKVRLFSETDCPRLPNSKAITIPLVKIGEEMPQLILDLRSARIYNWKSAVIIYDRTLGKY